MSDKAVEAAGKAIADYVGEDRFGNEPHARVALQAAAPYIGAEIREQIAAEVSMQLTMLLEVIEENRTVLDDVARHGFSDQKYEANCILAAARVARGTQEAL